MMNLSVIRYDGLRHKSNNQIQAKFCLVYGKVALYPRTVNTWAVRFRSGKISVEHHVFGLFHSRRVCFHRRTSEKKMIQFCLLYSNNSSKYHWNHEYTSPANTTQGHWLHIHNARPHKAALSFLKTEEARFNRLQQLPYSHDLAPCDFFLFGYLKKEREERNCGSENQVISAGRPLLEAITINRL
jgi:hypothetical protein